MESVEGERVIDIGDNPIEYYGSGIINPLLLNNKYLGDGNWKRNPGSTAGQAGVIDGTGLNNIGLLVTICGKYTWTDSHTFTINDGSGTVRCIMEFEMIPAPTWDVISVTGISSCRLIEGKLEKLLRVRKWGDIQPR